MNFWDNIDMSQYLPTVMALGMNVILAIITLLIGLWVARKANHIVVGMGEKSPHLDDTLFKFLGSVAKYLILAVVVIAILNRFGVQTASIIALLGAAGLAVGMALQGTLSNLAAGAMLMIFRPYKVGDYVDAADTFGRVAEIDIFTTTLLTFDKQQIIIPNSKIWGAKIINHSHSAVRGVDFTIGIAYKENTDVARRVIDKVLADHPHILKTPAPFVEVSKLNDSSVDFIVRPFCKVEDYFKVYYTFSEQIKKALDENNIEIPFPHRKVYLVNEDND